MRPKNEDMVPLVIESTVKGDRISDVYSRLLKDRIVFLRAEIDDHSATAVIAQLLYLKQEDPKEDIHFYIFSPGGMVEASLAIYDTMQMISNDICTYAVGSACSGAAVLLAAGTKGKRFALANSRIMIHQPSGGVVGDNTEIQIEAREIERLKMVVSRILAKHTGKSVTQVIKDCERDYFMNAAQAKKYGLVDKILSGKKISA